MPGNRHIPSDAGTAVLRFNRKGEQMDEQGGHEINLDEARGKGMGVGGPRQGDGGTDTCVCPACNKEVPHTRGTPCNEINCPSCGKPMAGK